MVLTCFLIMRRADVVLLAVPAWLLSQCRAGVAVNTGRRAARIANLLLFRIKDHRAGLGMVVSLPGQTGPVHADRRRCTWMYETRNETASWAQGGQEQFECHR